MSAIRGTAVQSTDILWAVVCIGACTSHANGMNRALRGCRVTAPIVDSAPKLRAELFAA